MIRTIYVRPSLLLSVVDSCACLVYDVRLHSAHPPITNVTKEAYVALNKSNSASINHFHEKLFKLKDLMKTG